MLEQKRLVEPGTFRERSGIFATGVTVIATSDGEKVHAMTANAVTSLSLDPPLYLFCVARGARMAKYMEQGAGFSVNILRQEQRALSDYFAGAWKGGEPPPFEFIRWSGGPLLKGCAAAIGCAWHQIHDGGDHWIVVGRVTDLYQGEEPIDPLLFYRGRYRAIGVDPAGPAL